MRPSRSLAAIALMACGLPVWAQAWDFEVRLDDKLIGTHRFTLSGPPEARELDSQARFEVTLLGIPVYRYRHQARERWRGDCLVDIQARTEDGGDPVRTVARSGEAALPGCLMSFAYWHPALTRQTRLLNPQTDQVDPVSFERLPDAPLRVHGLVVDAARWRIRVQSSPEPQALTLWLERASGRWIGLDAQVKGGRQLSYRLP